MTEQEYKPVPGYPNYRVSANGIVQSNFYGDWRTSANKSGQMSLYNSSGNKKLFKIGRIVAMAWLPNPDNCEMVLYKNRDSRDARLENLYWGNRNEVERREYRPSGSRHVDRMKNIIFRSRIVVDGVEYNNLDAAAKALDTNRATIYIRILNKQPGYGVIK